MPSNSSPFNVLIIEDEPVIRELVKNMLADGTLTVDTASTGPEGLKMARSGRYHLILLDVVLPQMDGLTICRLIKAAPETAGTPVYMLTAKSKKADVDAAAKAGASGYIQKPFRGAELMALVSKLRGTPA
ncbi:MAG: response regulator [Myxococcaceae bacterium]|nr:response regulator [Myxococcaceae bacterium]